MENFLSSKEHWRVVPKDIAKLTASTATRDAQKIEIEGQLKDLKAKNYLFQVINRSILDTILCKDIPPSRWIP